MQTCKHANLHRYKQVNPHARKQVNLGGNAALPGRGGLGCELIGLIRHLLTDPLPVLLPPLGEVLGFGHFQNQGAQLGFGWRGGLGRGGRGDSEEHCEQQDLQDFTFCEGIEECGGDDAEQKILDAAKSFKADFANSQAKVRVIIEAHDSDADKTPLTGVEAPTDSWTAPERRVRFGSGQTSVQAEPMHSGKN